ncbi:PREDICTED: uncharacterized protein LOC106817343 [Priapulus caudatus]|uniref:Uncharacterized protein LOC106817343 n=1 Tax=Priapulus caudatus TaxID=37621 RepID=A0ABM1EZ66_PRICU|nr:PREDICTED: uncharacterized protein LOC106817343 [Priapulus caudatus]
MFSSPMIVWWAVGTVLLSAVLGEDLASDAQVEGIVGQNLQLKCPFTLNNGDALYKNSWKMLNEGSLVTVYSYYQDPSNPRHPLRHLVNRSEVVCTKKECVLTIERVQAEDEGTYECDIEFDRKVGQSKVFHLSVYST